MEYTLKSSKTFRYFTLGDPSKAKYILYVLHGYGQLAEYFLNKFKDIGSDFYVVAPEGMHRFYLSGSSGRVGASWMTKEAREYDILDTMQWLDNLEAHINPDHSFEKKIILGFSQGGATAARWNTLGKQKADHCIFWASVFPPDLENILPLDPQLNQNDHFVLGNEDQYFTSEQQKQTIDYYSLRGYNTHLYEGNHTIDHKTLMTILTSVQKKIKQDSK